MSAAMRNASFLFVLASMLLGCGGAALPAAAIEHNTSGAELLSQGELERAEARFRLALEFQPGFAEARANLGLVALARGHLTEAEAHLRGAIGLREDFGEAWGNLGVVLERMHRDEEARGAYEQALSIHPGLRFARRDLGWLLARHGLHAEARAQLLRFVELAPEDAEAAGLLAWCELRLGRADAAREIAESALEIDAEARAPRLIRGILLAQRGDLADALADLEAVEDDAVLGREARIRIAAIWSLTDRGDEALASMEELLEATPDDPAVHLVAASAALGAERWDRARHHASEALREHPELEAALLVLAEACAHADDERCARHTLDRITSDDGAVAREASRLRAALTP